VFIIVIVWLAVNYLAADYFVALMKKYNISPTSSHEMFVDSVHRYLIWASLAASLLSLMLSYFFMKRLLTPLIQMTKITANIASGDYTANLPVSSRMAQSLQRIEQLRRTMIVDVAHELRTPLTNIQGYLEALVDGVVPGSKETVGLLQEETFRLGRLVEDILRLAKADAARENLDIMAITIHEAISNVLQVFRSKFNHKAIRIDTSGIDAAAQVYADPHKLAQVIDNLLQNAWQYTPPTGTLKIYTESEPEQIKAVFSNTGVEIDEKDLGLIFERFYRGEKSRSRDHGGAGIGLAIVKELIEAQNGRVGAAITDNETMIWFTLPTAPSASA
jgi:two-component system sensor histidine kinase BaeS